ncbi:MAG: hypothetical protein ACTSR0_04165 [Candidatus Asgardarchaeia archaeon]
MDELKNEIYKLEEELEKLKRKREKRVKKARDLQIWTKLNHILAYFPPNGDMVRAGDIKIERTLTKDIEMEYRGEVVFRGSSDVDVSVFRKEDLWLDKLDELYRHSEIVKLEKKIYELKKEISKLKHNFDLR